MIGETIPVLGVLTGLVVPITVFIWLYHEEKGKREAVIEIAKHLDDPAKGLVSQDEKVGPWRLRAV